MFSPEWGDVIQWRGWDRPGPAPPFFSLVAFERAFMLVADQYNPALHKIRDVPLANYLRRELKEPELFVMWHEIGKSWVLAIWEPWRRWQWFREVLVLGKALEEVNRETVHQLRYVLHGPPTNIRSRLREITSARKREEEDHEREYNDALRWLAKRQGTIDHPYFKE
jgi:hypothetical protein